MWQDLRPSNINPNGVVVNEHVLNVITVSELEHMRSVPVRKNKKTLQLISTGLLTLPSDHQKSNRCGIIPVH